MRFSIICGFFLSVFIFDLGFAQKLKREEAKLLANQICNSIASGDSKTFEGLFLPEDSVVNYIGFYGNVEIPVLQVYKNIRSYLDTAVIAKNEIFKITVNNDKHAEGITSTFTFMFLFKHRRLKGLQVETRFYY